MKYLYSLVLLSVLFTLGGCVGDAVTTTPAQSPAPIQSTAPTPSPTLTPNLNPTTSPDVTPIPTPAETLEPTPLPSVKYDNRIYVNQVQFARESLTVSFNTLFPDGTVFLSQLYENSAEVSWWPADRELTAEDEKAEITIILGENGVPQELPYRVHYTIRIWLKDDPSIIGGIGVISPGPAPTES